MKLDCAGQDSNLRPEGSSPLLCPLSYRRCGVRAAAQRLAGSGRAEKVGTGYRLKRKENEPESE